MQLFMGAPHSVHLKTGSCTQVGTSFAASYTQDDNRTFKRTILYSYILG